MPFFPGCRGRIHYESRLPDGEARSVVVLLHGYGEHLGLYDALVRRLVADGHAVYAMDEVGHGRSDGERVVITSWDDLVDDARTLATWPGGSTRALHWSSSATPGVGLRRCSSRCAPRRSPGRWCCPPPGEPPEFLSTHPEYVHALLTDPLTWKGGFRRQTLLALTATWPEVAAGLEAGRPDVPVLLVHGDADPVVPLEISQKLAQRLPRA